jgi:hypothetical protein
MKFEYESFSCDVDIFYKENDVLVRFYDSSKEQNQDEIINLVIVNSGYGYLLLKSKGDAALLSGFLDEDVFKSDKLVEEAVHFLISLSPVSGDVYTPYHVDRIKLTGYIEYNGEY